MIDYFLLGMLVTMAHDFINIMFWNGSTMTNVKGALCILFWPFLVVYHSVYFLSLGLKFLFNTFLAKGYK
jgi:hypothetical protein